MRLATVALVGSLLATPALAGESKTPAKSGGSCSMSGGMVCADYDASMQAQAKDACLKYKLTWSDKACPKAKVLGTCVKPEGAGKSYTHMYPPGTVEASKKACSNTPGGVFVP